MQHGLASGQHPAVRQELVWQSKGIYLREGVHCDQTCYQFFVGKYIVQKITKKIIFIFLEMIFYFLKKNKGKWAIMEATARDGD